MNDRVAVLSRCICALQEEKERSYGVDWKRFGLISSFFNAFRKLIRLRTVWESGWRPTKDDLRLDTIIDLLNYLILSVLLHAELFPKAFERTLPSNSRLKAVDFPSDERGFKAYVREFVMSENGATLALSETVPEILRIGNETIEEWLRKVEECIEKDGGASSPRLHSPEERLARIQEMISLCVLAAVRQGLECPEEWDAFVKRWG